MASLQDDMNVLLDDLKAADYDKEQMLEEIQAVCQCEESEALDIYDEWLTSDDVDVENATIGDIEDAYEELSEEGFSDIDILNKLSKKFGLTKGELKSTLGL